MNPSFISATIGSLFAAFSIFGIIVNIIVMIAMRKAELLSKSANPLYILATYSIFNSTVRLFITLVYWAPASFFQDPLIDDVKFGEFNFHSTNLVFGLWLDSSLTQLVIGVNRLFAVQNSQLLSLFTRTFCIVYVSTVLIIMTTSMYLANYLFPCCRTIFNYAFYTMGYQRESLSQTNYLQIYFTRLAAIGGYCVPVFCYLYIFCIIYMKRTQFRTEDSEIASKQRKEYRRTLPYALIFFFYFGMVLAVEVAPYLPKSRPYLYSIAVFCYVFDCIVTGLIQGLMNKRIRLKIIAMFGRNRKAVVFMTSFATKNSQIQRNSQIHSSQPMTSHDVVFQKVSVNLQESSELPS